MRKNQRHYSDLKSFSISELISLTDEIIDDDIILLATKSATFLKLHSSILMSHINFCP